MPLPYITHPMEVVARLRYGGAVVDEDVLAAAILHDIVEECGVSLSELKERFGPRVAALVGELTRTEPSHEETAGLAPGEVAGLRSATLLQEIGRQSADAQSIKLADRLSNLCAALATRSGERRARYIQQSRRILEIVSRDVNPALWDELDAMVKRA